MSAASQPLVPPPASAPGGEAADWDCSEDPTWLNCGRVMSHVTQKGLQAGGLIGCLVVAPVILYRARKAGPIAAALPRAVQALGRTALITAAVSTALGVARLASLEDLKAGVADRAYRLHYNAGQRRVDRFAQVGMLVGGSAAAALLPASAAAVVGGGAAGAAAGVLAHVATMRPKPE